MLFIIYSSTFKIRLATRFSVMVHLQ